MSDTDFEIQQVGPLNLDPEEADVLLQALAGEVEDYREQEDPDAEVLEQIQSKLHGATRYE